MPRQPHGALGSPNCSPAGTEAQEGYLLVGGPAGECSASQPSHHRRWKTVLSPMKSLVVRKTVRNVAALVAPKHMPRGQEITLPLSNPEVRRAAMGPQRAISRVSERRTLRIRARQCAALSQTAKETPSPNLPPHSPVLKVLTILCKLSISKTPAPFCPRYTHKCTIKSSI